MPGPASCLKTWRANQEIDMKISNPHNLVTAPCEAQQRYGIRVSLPVADPLRRLLPEHWETVHWYEDAATRDRALEDMSVRHRYSRIGDAPSVVYEPVER